MGRIRKDGNPLGLEARVYWKSGQWQYRHKDGRWEKLGTDIPRANARARIYNDPDQQFGTIGYFIDLYIAEAKAGRLLRTKEPRTIEDYEKHEPFLKNIFGKLYPPDLVQQPELIAEYRDKRTAKVRANRELSTLSAVYSWLIEKGYCPGLIINPVSTIARNPEKPKERYVEDKEYRDVYSIAVRQVCMAMQLSYITLQRPSDILRISATSVTTKSINGIEKKILSITQGKTGRRVNIEITPELDDALYMCSPDRELGKILLSDSVTKLVPTIIHSADLTPYTDDGIRAMLRRYCEKSGHRPFGLMDVRAKGATDMYLRDVPIEHIQMLMGHKSVTTTEIYLKRMLRLIRISQPNKIKIAG